MNPGDRIEIKKPFHDGYRWVPAEVTHKGNYAFDYRTEAGAQGTVEMTEDGQTEWRMATTKGK